MSTIEDFATSSGCRIVYKNEKDGILKIDNEEDGIHNLIIGIAPPILIMEHFLFSFKKDNVGMFKQLLQKNRDMIHGAFVINEEGNKVLFRYTMQIDNIDLNEFDGAINSLGLMLSEYYQQIIGFSKL
ncbi:YbjN domain-containing protein [Flavitalea antarctica]